MDKSALKARYPEAFAYLEARGVVPSDAFYSQLERLRQCSFTIAKLAQIEQIQRAKDSLVKAAQDGLSFDEWRKITTPEMLALPKSYQETVFRNAVLSAHNAGKWAHFRDNAERRPILRYSAVNDSRTRPAHRALHGLMMPIDDPRWQAIAPSNGHNCRCTLMSLSERQAKAFGYEGAPAQLPTYKDKHGHDVEAHADAGWAHSPEHDLTDYLREKEQKAGLPKAVFDSSKHDTKPTDNAWPPADDGTVESLVIRDIVLAGQKDGLEHGAVVDKLGNVIDRRTGLADRISYSDMIGAMAGMTLYHNHPSNSGLSIQDIYLAGMAGLLEIVAAGTNEAAIYRAKVFKTNADIYEFLRTSAVVPYRKDVQELFLSGKITEQEAIMLFNYAKLLVLDKHGYIEYNFQPSVSFRNLLDKAGEVVKTWHQHRK